MAQVFKNVAVTITFHAQLNRMDAVNLSMTNRNDEDRIRAYEHLEEAVREEMKSMASYSMTEVIEEALINVPSAVYDYCEDCGYTSVPEDATFCPGCGKELT